MRFKIFFLISLVSILLVNYLVINNKYNNFLVLLWLLSLFSLFLSTKIVIPKFKLNISNISIIGFIIILPILIRLIYLNPYRIHSDEFISSYFSAHYDFKTYNFFSAIPQNKDDWVNQFPTTYFVLQKIFFWIFGESSYTVKLSILPYVFIVSLMTYLISAKIFNKKTALISVVLSSFFAVSIYLELMGLHFISSTAVFLLFFYFAILAFEKEDFIYSVATGFFCAFCYLFYFSSYIAFPFLILFYFIKYIKYKKFWVLKSFLLSIVAFIITLSPFFSYAYKFNNYMPVRFQQVSLANQIKDAKEGYREVIKTNFINSVQSLYKDGIGGHGGYDFGHVSFFSKFSFWLFILSSFCSFYLMITAKKKWLFFIWLVILISFFGSMVLTIPPPAYHRFSIAYPFIMIIYSSLIYLILSLKARKLFQYLLIMIIIVSFAVSNVMFLNKAISIDAKNQEEEIGRIKIIKYLEKNYPDRKIYFASFPSYAFEKVYYFFNPKRQFITEYHDNLLRNFNRNEKYIYIIIFPTDFDEKFKYADPNGRIINNLSPNYSLFIN